MPGQLHRTLRLPHATALVVGTIIGSAVFVQAETDTPSDNELGSRLYRETIPAVQAMPIDEESRRKILSGNAQRLFRLPAG